MGVAFNGRRAFVRIAAGYCISLVERSGVALFTLHTSVNGILESLPCELTPPPPRPVNRLVRFQVNAH